MTYREFYTAIANAQNASAELVEFATDAIAKLDAKNAKRASKPSKTAVANEPIKASIASYLAGKSALPASEIAVACDISTQKASALCRQLVANGTLTVDTVKVPKKGEVKVYSIA